MPSVAAPRPTWKRFAVGAAFLACVALVFATGLHRKLSYDALLFHFDKVQAFVAAHGVVAMGVYLAIYAGAVALSIPGALFLTLVAGLVFGPWIGGSIAVLGATVGACLLFCVARTTIGDALAARAGPVIARLAEGFRADAFSYLLALRLAPIVPFWATNLAAALLGVPFRTFLVATFAGIMPATYAFAFTAAGLSSVVRGQSEALKACKATGASDCAPAFDITLFLTRDIALALFGLAVIALVPVVVKRWRARRVAGAS
jgi:uncharacterized membrane protein YdjX (TVP38/TMEM64 family)